MLLTEPSEVIPPSCANKFSYVVGIIPAVAIKANARIDKNTIDLSFESIMFFAHKVYNN
jgi:hypothetical protein